MTWLKLRTYTKENAEKINAVLPVGYLCLELETGKIKLGDGFKTWNEAPYFEGDLEKHILSLVRD